MNKVKGLKQCVHVTSDSHGFYKKKPQRFPKVFLDETLGDSCNNFKVISKPTRFFGFIFDSEYY